MKTWNQTISLFSNDEQKIVAHGYPDLRVDCVLGGSVEGLDVQMLLDPFEEQFNRQRSRYSSAMVRGSSIAKLLVRKR